MADASCRLVSVLFDVLDEVGVPHEALVEGTDLDLDFLKDEGNWIAWDELNLIGQRASLFAGGDDALQERASRLVMKTSSYASMTAVSQVLAGPKSLYKATARWVSSQLFSMVHWRYEDVDENRLRMHLSYDDRYVVMQQLEVMVGATMVALPTILGLPRAMVTAEVDGRSLIFHIHVPPSKSLWSRVLRLFRAVFAPDSLTWELERQALTLEQRNLELESARVREEQASSAKTRFLATISHELRTPLNGILGSAQLLEKMALSAEQAELVEANRASAAHLMALIESILDFNRIYAGDVELTAEAFNLRELLEDRLRSASPWLRDGGNRWCLEMPEGDWPVCADRAWLGRALDALLDNAARFTQGGEVTLRAEAPEGLEDCWTLTVEDTGQGMSPARFAEAFAPLSQGDDSLTRAHGGLGLGLALVRHAVETMGGHVGGDSEEGRGTRIWLTLPMPPAPGGRVVPPIAPVHVPAPTAERPCILIVEDHPVNQLILRRLLDVMGYSSEVASDGAEGVERYREGSYAAVLMDCQMPVMDGHTATRHIRALETQDARGRVPIIAVTAHAMDTDRRSAIDAGMDRYLTKPVLQETLALTLDELLAA